MSRGPPPSDAKASRHRGAPNTIENVDGPNLSQLHSSLKGGSLEQGGIDGLTAPAPPLDADTPLDAAPLLGVDTRRDP